MVAPRAYGVSNAAGLAHAARLTSEAGPAGLRGTVTVSVQRSPLDGAGMAILGRGGFWIWRQGPLPGGGVWGRWPGGMGHVWGIDLAGYRPEARRREHVARLRQTQLERRVGGGGGEKVRGTDGSGKIPDLYRPRSGPGATGADKAFQPRKFNNGSLMKAGLAETSLRTGSALLIRGVPR